MLTKPISRPPKRLSSKYQSGTWHPALTDTYFRYIENTARSPCTCFYCCVYSLLLNLNFILVLHGPRAIPPQAAGLAITPPFGAKVSLYLIPCTSCRVLAWATMSYLIYGPHTADSLVTLGIGGRGIAACSTPSALCWSPVREGTSVLWLG